jgi:hypothetical protein
VFAASSNQGKLFRFGSELINEGSYESPVRDAKLTASWDESGGRGAGNVEVPNKKRVMASEPDATWSEWSGPYKPLTVLR